MFSWTEVSFWKIRILRIKKNTLNCAFKIQSGCQVAAQFSNHAIKFDNVNPCGNILNIYYATAIYEICRRSWIL